MYILYKAEIAELRSDFLNSVSHLCDTENSLAFTPKSPGDKRRPRTELLRTHLTRNLVFLQHMSCLTVNHTQSFPSTCGNCPRAISDI